MVRGGDPSSFRRTDLEHIRSGIRTTDAINSEAFIEFLQELLKTCPKFVMVLDNASCHRSKMVTEFVESTDGDIRLVFLPPYTPQLNPIEMQWSVLKRLLPGRYFRSVGELKKAIMAIVDSGETKPVRLMSYLMPPSRVGVAARLLQI